MSNFHDLIVRRHSIRRYTDEPISADDVTTILQAALMAPSSKRTMPWEFLLIEDKEKLQELSKCREMGTLPLANCSLAIFVMANPEITDAWIEDASIAAAYMQLQAEDLGLGSCWVQIRNRYTAVGESAQDFISGIVSLPPEQMILCAITLGHKAEERKPFDLEKLKWEKVHIAK